VVADCVRLRVCLHLRRARVDMTRGGRKQIG
jgi:hypothetical protein